MKKLFLILLLVSSAYGQYTMTNVVYSTDFATSSTGYVWTTNGNGTGLAVDSYPSYWGCVLNGQDGWVSNQDYLPDVNGPGLNEYAANYNVGSWKPTFAAFGGDTYNNTTTGYLPSYPQNITNTWTRSFNNNTNSIHFESKFAVNASAPNTNNQWDTFTFTLYNKETNALFSINLNAADANGSNWSLTYSTYGHDGATNVAFKKPNGQILTPLVDMQLVWLGFDVLNLGQTNQSLIMYNTYWTNSNGTPSIILTNSLRGSDYSGIDTNITALAATWQLADTTSTNYVDGSNIVTVYPGYAENTLLVQSITVAVPEPPVFVLLSLTGLVIVLRRNIFA